MKLLCTKTANEHFTINSQYDALMFTDGSVTVFDHGSIYVVDLTSEEWPTYFEWIGDV